MKKLRRLISLLLVTVMLLSTSLEVFATESGQAPKPTSGGSGTVSTNFFAVRLREVTGGPGTTEDSVYMSKVYGLYPEDMFTSSFLDNTVLINGNSARHANMAAGGYYNYDGMSVAKVQANQVVDVSNLGDASTAYISYMKNTLIKFLSQGGDYKTCLTQPDVATAGKELYKIIYDSKLPDVVSAISSGYESKYVYGAVLLTLYAASNGYVSKSMIDTYFSSYNNDGSSSYIYMDVFVLAGDRSAGVHQLFTYQSFWGYMYQVNASSLCVTNRKETFTGFQTDRQKHFMEDLSDKLAGRTIVNDVHLNATYYFGYNWKTNGTMGKDSKANGGIVDMCTQVEMNPSTGTVIAKNGMPGITHLSRSTCGPIPGDGVGNIYLSVTPKDARYGGVGSVNADGSITLSASTENILELSKHTFPAQVVLNLTSTQTDGSATNDGRLVNSKNVGTINSNTSNSSIVTIAISNKTSLEKWLTGQSVFTFTDSSITPNADAGVRILYSVSGTLMFQDGYQIELTAKGAIITSTTVASDYASWIGKNPVVEYHSSDGSNVAYGEVKSNVPNAEQWEAMGGIPTTENVYAAGGGQAFQVDLKGQVRTNPETFRTVTINVTTTNNWGEDKPCVAVCTGHPKVHGAHPYTIHGTSTVGLTEDEIESMSSAGSIQEDQEVTCEVNEIEYFEGKGPESFPAEGPYCGEVTDNGPYGHGPVGEDHYTHWSGDIYGDKCSGETNARHPETKTYTYKVQIPVDQFTYFDMLALNVDYLNSMSYTANNSLFNYNTGDVNNNQSMVAYFDVPDSADYTSGCGRLYFSRVDGLSSVESNSLTDQAWGDLTINVTTEAGSDIVGGHYQQDGEHFTGAKDSDAKKGATTIANDIITQLNSGDWVCTIISDYAEIGQGGSYQTVNAYMQDSVAVKVFDGVVFDEPKTIVATKRFTWSADIDADKAFYNNPYRTLTTEDSVMRVGYNGKYTEVTNNGNMSGKFTNQGVAYTYGDSWTFKWYDSRGQKHVQKQYFNDGVDNYVPMFISGIDIKDDYQNGRVPTGNMVLNYADGVLLGEVGSGAFARCNSVTCKYKDGDTTINDIVIHDPVSVEYCEVVTLPKSKDHRIDGTSIWYGGDEGATNVAPSGTFPKAENGVAFINIGENFTVVLSYLGNFNGTGALGIAECTDDLCYGFRNAMDCKKWTKEMYATLPVSVRAALKDGSENTYSAYEKIPLSTLKPVSDSKPNEFEFTCLTNSYEAIKAQATFFAEAINTPYDDGRDESNGMNNAIRTGSNAAKHTARKNQYVDVVGQIGNLTINDTGDFRFASLFKRELTSGEWLIPSLVRKVDYSKPNMIASDPIDILGNKAEASTQYHSTLGVTYARTGGKAWPFVNLPLTPSDNPVDELRNQEMRPGYNLYMDVETIGNYYGENFDEFGNTTHENLSQRMVIIPRYWSYDKNTQQYTPVDVYYGESGEYQLLLSFNRDKSYNSEWIYYLNWKEESARRNYVTKEKELTAGISQFYSYGVLGAYFKDEATKDLTNNDGEPILTWKTKTVETPADIQVKDRIGTAASLFLDSLDRTFIGSPYLYGKAQVVGSKAVESVADSLAKIAAERAALDSWNGVGDKPIVNDLSEFSELRFGRQSQRWNFTLGLPSSAVFVAAGSPCTEDNIKALQSKDKIIVCALNIKVQGEIWALEYDGTAVNWDGSGPGKGIEVYPNEFIKPPTESDGSYVKDPIVTIYNSTYTSEDDLRTEGTH